MTQIQKNLNPTERIAWPDFIRTIAAFLIVMIHCGAGHVGPYSVLYATISKPAVLWFFMISGYLLLKKEETIRDFFQKRFGKVAIPLLFFSLIYGILNIDNLPQSKVELYDVMSNGVHFHLWFMHALIACYLIIPLLRPITQKGPLLVVYFIIIWFFFYRFMPIERRILDVTEMVFGPSLGFLGQFSGYFMIGWLAGNYEVTKKIRPLLIIIWVISSAFTGIAALSPQPLNTFGLGYVSPGLMISASTGFILLKDSITRLDGKWLKTICDFAPLTLGIYLIHPLLLQYAWPKNLPPLNPLIMIPIKTTVAFFASAIIVILIRKSKFGRIISP